MLRGGIAGRLVNMTTAFVGHWPGGLGIGMVLAMGFFAAFCGSILAAITAVGTIMMPKMIDQGYPAPFVIVLAAAAALLEALIPPSNAAIVFSALTNVPVSKTFAAGIIPGLVLMILLIVLVSLRCRHIRIPEKPSRQELWVSIREALPGLMTPVIILGGIYGGFVTIVEAAGLGVLGALVISFARKRLTWKITVDALVESLRNSAAIFFILIAAFLFQFFLAVTQAPQLLAGFLGSLDIGPTGIIILIMIFYILAGMFVDDSSTLMLGMIVRCFLK